MSLDASFYAQIQSHIGGFVMVRLTNVGFWSRKVIDFNGKIGLLVRADYRGPTLWRVVVLFIDGSIKTLDIFAGDLEFLGAKDA
jgi:hypothetical protein